MEVHAIDDACSLPFGCFFPRRLRVVAECLAVGAVRLMADSCDVIWCHTSASPLSLNKSRFPLSNNMRDDTEKGLCICA